MDEVKKDITYNLKPIDLSVLGLATLKNLAKVKKIFVFGLKTEREYIVKLAKWHWYYAIPLPEGETIDVHAQKMAIQERLREDRKIGVKIVYSMNEA